MKEPATPTCYSHHNRLVAVAAIVGAVQLLAVAILELGGLAANLHALAA
jgi:hypothetical protein